MQLRYDKGICMLKDLIYFDVEKSASLLSQLEEGLVKDIQTTINSSDLNKNLRTYDAKLFKGEFGGISEEKSTLLENRILHDYLLVKIEKYLTDNKYLVNVNSLMKQLSYNSESLWEKIPTDRYILVEGWVKFEDYARLHHIADNFGGVVDLINKSVRYGFETSDGFMNIKSDIEDRRKKLKEIKDRNQRINEENNIREIEKKLEIQLAQVSSIQNVPDWIISGIKDWIRVFCAKRIDLRMILDDQFKKMQFIASLKRECFVDTDLENILHAYGTRPNVKLTVLGIVTSKPELIAKDLFSFENESEDKDSDRQFEDAFRSIFSSMEGIEDLIRFARFPNVQIIPLAIYRKLGAIE